MDYSIEMRTIEPVRVAYLHYKGVATKANAYFPSVFKAIQGKASGAPFFNYHSIHPESKMGELDLCVPTEQTPFGNGIEVKTLPAFKALCTTHIGSYETLIQGYNAIYQFAKANNLELQSPFREIYIKGPGLFLKGNPKHYITEIQFPIKESHHECNCRK